MEIKRGFSLLVFIIVFSNVVSSLGISPGSVNIEYVPGAEHEFKYTVITEDPESEVLVNLVGWLAKYANVSTERLRGTSTFFVYLKLPESIEIPGFHELGVHVREVSSEEGSITTSVAIQTDIKIFVPYPGKYLEASLGIPDANFDSILPVEVRLANKGKESVLAKTDVKFFSSPLDFIFSLSFDPLLLDPGQERFLSKNLNMSIFKPGNYLAEAIVDYGETVQVNRTFRIGYLFVNITNFTSGLEKKSIQKFFIEVESNWNEYLDNVYAIVNVSNSTFKTDFKTVSTDLPRWEKKTLEGFLDTDKLEGAYDTDITVFYKDERSFASGELTIIKKESNLTFIIIGIIIAIIIIVLICEIVIKKFLKRRK